MNRKREPEGIPVGGQWATERKSEADVQLVATESDRTKEIFASSLSTEKLRDAVFSMSGTDGEPAWRRIDDDLDSAEDFYESTRDPQYADRYSRDVASEALAESGLSLSDVVEHRSAQRAARRALDEN